MLANITAIIGMKLYAAGWAEVEEPPNGDFTELFSGIGVLLPVFSQDPVFRFCVLFGAIFGVRYATSALSALSAESASFFCLCSLCDALRTSAHERLVLLHVFG